MVSKRIENSLMRELKDLRFLVVSRMMRRTGGRLRTLNISTGFINELLPKEEGGRSRGSFGDAESVGGTWMKEEIAFANELKFVECDRGGRNGRSEGEKRGVVIVVGFNEESLDLYTGHILKTNLNKCLYVIK